MVQGPAPTGEERLAIIRQRLTTSSAILAREYEPDVWVLDGLILQRGLTLFVSKLGNGKSYFALGLAIAISNGTPFLNRAMRRAKALYLGLEDSDHRLRKRLDQLSAIGTSALFVATDWERGRKGIEDLRLMLQMEPEIACVVIDPAARFLQVADTNDYTEMYQAIAELKAVAGKVGIVLVHHCKKEVCADPFDDALGSTAISAAADNRLVLRRTRGQPDGTLYAMGKDVDYQELAVRQEENGAWILLGNAKDVYISDKCSEILDVLRREGPLTAAQVAEALGKNLYTTRNQLGKMFRDGQVYKAVDGRWVSEPETESRLVGLVGGAAGDLPGAGATSPTMPTSPTTPTNTTTNKGGPSLSLSTLFSDAEAADA